MKTDLFPHQRKALTFLLQKEQDWSSLKSARKYFTKLDEKKRSRKKKAESNAAAETTGSNTPTESEEQNSKDKEDTRSLWEGKKDEKGRVRIWKNKITQEEIRTKKGERPPDSKGAILADDVSSRIHELGCQLTRITDGSGKDPINRLAYSGDPECGSKVCQDEARAGRG